VSLKDRVKKLRAKQHAASEARKNKVEAGVHRPTKPPSVSVAPSTPAGKYRPVVVESDRQTTIKKFLENVCVSVRCKEVTKAGIVILRNAVLTGYDTGLDDRLFRFGDPPVCQPVFARIVLNPNRGTVECWGSHDGEEPRLTLEKALVGKG